MYKRYKTIFNVRIEKLFSSIAVIFSSIVKGFDLGIRFYPKMKSILIFLLPTLVFSQEPPTLPTLWRATTIDPPMGQGIEEYKYVNSPTKDNPSAMWSKYKGCSRLIYVDGVTQTRFLLGCDAVDCCTEEQEGNQVEFQIPNYTSRRDIPIKYQKVNITNFGEEVEADEWSWNFNIEKFIAYTRECKSCYNGIQLLQWKASVLGEGAVIQFKDYHGIDPESDEGKEFVKTFEIPDVCKNVIECPKYII